MNLAFSFPRTVQAAAFLLIMSPVQRLTRFRILKLLYIAERELLVERSFVLTGDKPFAWKHGPLLSHTYNLIKAQGEEAGEWASFIGADGAEVFLRHDPGVGQLPVVAQAKLTEVAKRYHDLEDPELEDVVHEFAEWQSIFPPGSNSSFPIQWEVLLGADRAKEIEEEERAFQLGNQLLGGRWRERQKNLSSCR